MKYAIEKKNGIKKLVYYNTNIYGLTVRPINKSETINIKAKKVTLVDDELIKNYIKKLVNKKFDKIIDKMMRILNENDFDSESGGNALDELSRLKGIIEKKYKEYMTKTEYTKLMNKIFVVESEFKSNYNQKMYFNYLTGNLNSIENSVGRGR